MDSHAAHAWARIVSSPVKLSVAAALVALLALLGTGAFLINAYIGQERQRDLLQWESRLGLAADAKVDTINRFLDASRRDVDELAQNASVRFYVWQFLQARPTLSAGSDPEAGSLGYLRNLLLAAAERYGYTPEPGARIPANLPQSRASGLAMLDAELTPLVATPGLGDLGDAVREVARQALATADGKTIQLVRDGQDRPVLVTAAAIGAVPGAGGAAGEAPLGVVLGLRSAEEALYPLLERGPSFAEESEALLVEKRGDTVALLSPTRDGSPGLRRTLPADRSELAEIAAITSPGNFQALSNYRGDDVLQVSRQVRGQDWVLVQQVDAAQALSLADERRRFLLIALSLLLFLIAAVAVAAWRHGSSVRAQHHADDLADKAARLQRQTDLLHTITDNLDVATLLVTSAQRVKFTNKATAEAAGSSIEAMLDSTLSSFLPPPVLQELQEGIEHARKQGAAVHRILQWQNGELRRDYQVSFIPVERIGEERGLTLLVLSDLTELQQIQRRHTDLLRRLVLTLVSAVDRHDPYSAHHAQRMTEVADALARELGFNDRERNALDLAASLANIGKVMIPVEVLTKTTPLTADEQRQLHKHVEYGLDLLRDLEFEGPVLDIIAQKNERPDGRGYPHGITGERITLAGQVLAVANAFVALISTRAYRPGLSVQAALEELMRGAGTQFDRRVVAALFHVAENRRDWSQPS